MMRFARFALRTKFKPGKEDEEVVRKHAPEIKMLAMDKIKKECDAALQSGSAGKFLEILDGLELLKEVMPEKIKLYRQYLSEMSLRTDLNIFFKTIWEILVK